MSWLGGSISSFTDQLSSFTKDILTEGTEEVSDHVTELRVAKSKITELEGIVSSYKTENDRFRHTTQELHEKSESSELQVFRISQEYRILLQQKETEIKELKDKQNELIEHQAKSSSFLPTHHSDSPSSLDRTVGSQDGDEIGDNISMQREINKLRHETQRLRMQCDHWKGVAQNFKKDVSSVEESEKNDVSSLKAQLREIKQQSSQEKEEHQQEIATLQDIHSQKLTTLKQQHEVKVTQLEDELKTVKLSLNEAEEKSLEASEETHQLSTMENLADIQDIRQSLQDSANDRQDHILQEKMHMANELKLALRQKKELENSLKVMEKKQMELSQETEKLVSALGTDSSQTEIISSLQKENNILKNKVLEIKEQLLIVEKTVGALALEGQHDQSRNNDDLENTIAALRGELEEKNIIIDSLKEDSNLTDISDIENIEDMRQQLIDSEQRINEMCLQRDELETSLEQLDSQHEMEMTQMLNIKTSLTNKVNNLEKDIKSRDNEIETLNVDLSKLKKDNEKVVEKMQAEGNVLKTEVTELKVKLAENCDNNNLEEKVEELSEKLKDNAMSLNDLHMDKAELEQDVKGKDEKIKRLVEKVKQLKIDCEASKEGQVDTEQLKNELLLMKTNLDSRSEEVVTLKDKLEQLEVSLKSAEEQKEEYMCKVSDMAAQLDLHKIQRDRILQKDDEDSAATNKHKEIENELKKVSELNSQLVLENKNLKIDKERVHEEIKIVQQQLVKEQFQNSEFINDQGGLLGKINNYEKVLCEKDKALEESVSSENDLLKKVEQLQKQNDLLETKMVERKDKFDNQNEYYERIVEDLKREASLMQSKMDKTHSDSIEEIAVKNNQITEKEETIKVAQNDCLIAQTQAKEKSEAMKKLVEEKDEKQKLVNSLEKDVSKLANENEILLKNLNTVKKQTDEILEDKSAVTMELSNLQELKDSERETENKELLKLQQKLQSQFTEISVLQEDKSKMHENIMSLKTIVSELENKNVAMLDENTDKIMSMQEKLDKQEDENLILVERAQKLSKELMQMTENTNNSTNSGEEVRNFENIDKKISELQGIIDGKDGVINDLQKTNASLLKLLDNKATTTSSEKLLLDIHKQKSDINTLKMEKEQMMAVLNEKTRECSSLKAEVHRLMSTVMAEKTAITKLQRDNVELQNTPQKVHTNLDMQKDAIQKLSNIVKDKDLEIESLAMKNGSLLELLQGSVDSGNELNKLISERDQFKQHINELTQQKEQILLVLNQKHQESVAFHNEVLRLKSVASDENYKVQHQEQEYSILKTQFEDCKLALVKVNDELVTYKQKYTDLEIKFGEMAQRDDIKNTVDVASYNEKINEVSRLKDAMLVLEKTVTEKTHALTTWQHSYAELESNFSTVSIEKNSFKKQIDNLAIQIHMLQQENNDQKLEFDQTDEQCKKQSTEIAVLKEINDKLSLTLREKEIEVTSVVEKMSLLQAVMGENETEGGQLELVLKENESLQKQTQVSQQESDQLTLALKQRQNECAQLTEQIQKMKAKDQKQLTELGRLRDHLIKIEESYTQEALVAEEREKDLRTRLVRAEDQVTLSNQTIQIASQQTLEEVESLRAQLSTLATQRDNSYLQVANLQDQVQEYKLQLGNLQMVLDEFQKEKDSVLAAETERYKVTIARQQHQLSSVSAELNQAKEQLNEAVNALEASTRLTDQLDRKEDTIRALRDEVHLREKCLEDAESTIKKHKVSFEGKVDKLLMKNMMLNYFSTPAARKSDIIHTIGGILGFNHEEFVKATGQTENSWVPGFLRFRSTATAPSTPSRSREPSGSNPMTPQHTAGHNQSFSELFVKFLEKESTPRPTVHLPAQEMADETMRQKLAYNPFTAPRHATLPLSPGGRNSPHENHPLMASAVNQDVPLFVNLAQSNIPGIQHTLNTSYTQSGLTGSQSHIVPTPGDKSFVGDKSFAPLPASHSADPVPVSQSYINPLVNPLPRGYTPSPLTVNPSSSAILKNALSNR